MPAARANRYPKTPTLTPTAAEPFGGTAALLEVGAIVPLDDAGVGRVELVMSEPIEEVVPLVVAAVAVAPEVLASALVLVLLSRGKPCLAQSEKNPEGSN